MLLLNINVVVVWVLDCLGISVMLVVVVGCCGVLDFYLDV